MDETTGDCVDDSRWHDKDMENIVGSLPSEEIPPELQNYNVTYNTQLTYVALLQNDNCSTPYKFLGYFTCDTKMKSSCVVCKDIVRNLVHLCNAVREVHNDNGNYRVFVCRSFERHFDLCLGEEICVCNSNLTLDSNNEDLFFYHVTPPPEQDIQPPLQ